MPDFITEQDTVVVEGMLMRLVCLKVLQSSGVQVLQDVEPVGVHGEAGQLVHDLVQQHPLFVTVTLHCQGDTTLGVCQTITKSSQFCRVGVPAIVLNCKESTVKWMMTPTHSVHL